MSVGDGSFRKHRAGAPPGFFEAEAAGLRWLAAAGGRVVGVLEVGADGIVMERLEAARPTAACAAEFGRMLALVHAAGASEYGSAPDGYHGQLYIGARPMGSGTAPTWGRFYGQERVRPFLPAAVAAGHLTETEAREVEQACEVVESGVLDATVPGPARIHGDLWSGNVFWTADGVVLIDPAAHGGHPETDLAMLELFGCPFLEQVLAGYAAVADLAPGRDERVPVHQLHPLAVHAAGHGRGYGVELVRAARYTVERWGSSPVP
ncbi:phosphotransferase [Rhodococcus triatomae]|uniref:Fructosamine-3-kinase n=1 Tax=Rhodococcus triatomae TaxID=300028 RepID=A0A1G8RMR7_9NOCA|nr:fructosamine kinase family protein [Rhodococcus triatomae]QNG19901.1 phosphotransferase [Rhodococcus triatomae]QNG24184.1 phosphotransferase [Rhodococcus triatomae]SDJ18229.1 Fructosamine-3-kinase [Rhodococcus triatomae]